MTSEVEATYSPGPSPTLKRAWERQRTYSKNATAAQKRFFLLRIGILILSVLATLLAVLHSMFIERLGESHHTVKVIHYVLLLVPIALSVLLAGAVKFDKGGNWILLRGSAEAIKREIYCYRAQVGEYSDNTSRDAKLARKVKVISQRLKGTTVHHTSFSPYEGEVSRRKRSSLSKDKKRQEAQQHNQDDKFSDLTPENYLVWRVEDQFKWYRKRTRKLDIQLHGYQWGVYILGGVGSFLVALGEDIWVAVSTAFAAAFSSFLELKRVETTLIAYNQAADDLYDISTWWHGLSDEEKLEKFELLVISTEKTIQSENVGWVQEMNDALAELYGETQESEDQGKNPSPSKTVDTK
ncbi:MULTISPECIES: DUF4231 domain-containing protein [Moorena]|uniref:SMODS and SLOG-associating 2TM effector domain-containing protein n=1 Tax=Moorena producens 3L TaxID=489825 RepID=F4Y102_9CYAN|nr:MULTISPECIES: DUF4231 domain-containing protein [Moorena]EGJ29513.1 hypothetical protein LYNGBM3L_63080 [Moorena producens 3L]NEP65721.1 DUF4231 domain-containing protein [Moorena sp. SIO3A5]OLT67964.1 hypothetical protein BI334_25695 [Moorena producens 3L]